MHTLYFIHWVMRGPICLNHTIGIMQQTCWCMHTTNNWFCMPRAGLQTKPIMQASTEVMIENKNIMWTHILIPPGPQAQHGNHYQSFSHTLATTSCKTHSCNATGTDQLTYRHILQWFASWVSMIGRFGQRCHGQGQSISATCTRPSKIAQERFQSQCTQVTM